MTVIVPATAPARPPLTGASMNSIPEPSSAAAMASAASTPVVDMLISALTRRTSAAATAFATSSEAAPSGTQTKTTSQARAMSSMLPAGTAPSGARSSVPALSYTWTPRPPATMFATMAAPMVPSPT